MSILLSFAPWILLWVLKMWIPAWGALLISIIISLLSDRKRLKKGFLVSWVVLGSMFVMLILDLVFGTHLEHWISSVVMSGSFAAMAWISLLVGSPFTYQYAKETVPEDKWSSPQFVYVNRLLTAIWAAAMTANVISSIFDYKTTLVSILAIVVPIYLTKKIPEYYKKKAQKKV